VFFFAGTLELAHNIPMSGPKRLPRTLRLLRNTLKPCRDEPATSPSLPAIDDAPTAPAWMRDVVAVSEFRRLGALLAINKMLTAGRVDTLADYCMLSARTQAAWQAGETPSAALLAIKRKLAGDLNLTALTLATPSAKPNRFLVNAIKRK
jgi:hypothetical protein